MNTAVSFKYIPFLTFKIEQENILDFWEEFLEIIKNEKQDQLKNKYITLFTPLMNIFLEISLEKCILEDKHLELYNTKTKEEIDALHEIYEEKEKTRLIYNSLVLKIMELLKFNKVIVIFAKVLEQIL